MPITPSYPGVYVQEVPSGVRTIVGVPTSTALFIGRTKGGPMFTPTLCLSYTDFESAFGDDGKVGELGKQVRLFYMNGGTRAWIVRIAKDATTAVVTLSSEAGQEVLTLSARSAGATGEDIRALVTYAGPQPEAAFNIQLFRWVTEAPGRRVQKEVETFRNLTMNPASPAYAPTFLTQNSKLVSAAEGADIGGMSPNNGFSQSGRAVPVDSTDGGSFQSAWAALLGSTASTNNFEISIGTSRWVPVSLSGITVGTSSATLASDVASAIQAAFAAQGIPGVTVNVSFEAGPDPALPAPIDSSQLLRITATTDEDVRIRSAGSGDLAVPLMLGTEQGGLEIGAFAHYRPAPTGVTYGVSHADLVTFAETPQKDIAQLTLQSVKADGTLADVTVPLALRTTNPSGDDPMFRDESGGFDGVREKLRLIQKAVEDQAAADSTFAWTAEVWGSRLALLPTRGGDNFVPATVATGTVDLGGALTVSTRYYSVGAGGTGSFQTPAAAAATDGVPPLLPDYQEAFKRIDREVDLFNLMILPPDDPSATPQVDFKDVWGPASVFCQKRRAFLLMDAPKGWPDVQTAQSQIGSLRIGLVKDHAALYFPRLMVSQGGTRVPVGPSGAVAGLMSRIDGSRGVWKAPAGVEADLRGVVGIERAFSDDENGVLNPRAINTIRAFPNGIVVWGARTMDGDDDFASEYKYVPIRRLALFIEESLYRGLKWVTFEPNDEPLWSQIRLNVGAFMNNLFRQGAFQGGKPKDAYFVKCDAETTTQNDRNLGIVNIWVGFAPLKPAEFVFLYLQQMAGQVQA